MKIAKKFRYILATTALLIAAKLAGIIGWSWWVVTFALWGLPAMLLLSYLLLGVVMLATFIYFLIAGMFDFPASFNPVSGQPDEPKKTWDEKLEELRKKKDAAKK